MLLHAPEYASVTSFIDDYPIGVQCRSLETSDLTAALSRLDRLPQEAITQAITTARQTELNSDMFAERFRHLVGAERHVMPAADSAMAGQL